MQGSLSTQPCYLFALVYLVEASLLDGLTVLAVLSKHTPPEIHGYNPDQLRCQLTVHLWDDLGRNWLGSM